MKVKISLLLLIIFSLRSLAQNVGIGTTSPAASSILDIKTSSKGILFPRLTTVQRNAILSPADGLHVFNTTINSLEYYDSAFKVWTPYCIECGVFYDTLHYNGGNTQYIMYSLPIAATTFKKIMITVQANVNVVGDHFQNSPAISLQGALPGSIIIINNYGNIMGYSGFGGDGAMRTFNLGWCNNVPATNGVSGGPAITSVNNTTLRINNYGIIGGGGGGGGGGMYGNLVNDSTSGGGGGGAGAGSDSLAGSGGQYTNGPGNNCITYFLVNSSGGQDGHTGTLFAGGTFGYGGNEGPIISPVYAGFHGGNGGNIGQPGQPGIGTPHGTGGTAGKAVSGNAGKNTIVNIGTGAVYGVVD